MLALAAIVFIPLLYFFAETEGPSDDAKPEDDRLSDDDDRFI